MIGKRKSNISLKNSVLAIIAAIAPQLITEPAPVAAQTVISADEAREIAVEAYLYFYPLVTMDITRKQLTNIEPRKEFGKGPMNAFWSFPEYPSARFKSVVRPNFDTLYSSAWLDLTEEPMAVSAPDTGGRYYLLPMLDMWTDEQGKTVLDPDFDIGDSGLPQEKAALPAMVRLTQRQISH